MAGFWTLHGDVGDLGPIQYLYKGLELPQIAEELKIREDIITQKPSDGLGVTEENTDEAQLGMTYVEFDTIYSIISGECDAYKKILDKFEKFEDTKIVNMVIDKVSSTNFKRENPINLGLDVIGNFRKI
jgi:nicotinamide-nucleotide amidase